MLKFYIASLALLTSLNALAGQGDSKKLLQKFHDYNLRHCDHVILKHGDLEDQKDFSVKVFRHQNGLDANATEVTARIYQGEPGDSLYKRITVIQTKSNCKFDWEYTMVSPTTCQDAATILKSNPKLNRISNTDFYEMENSTGQTAIFHESKVGGGASCTFGFFGRSSMPRR